MEQLTILRDGKRKILSVTIGKLNQEKLIVQVPAQSAEEIGLTVQTLTPQFAEQFDAEPGEGVVVNQVRPGSIAARAGIEPGSVILQVNGKAVQSAVEFQRVPRESATLHWRLALSMRKWTFLMPTIGPSLGIN
jgi:serine protease Do